jgi:glycosyltransferase involved in cell wall biosynthesis
MIELAQVRQGMTKQILFYNDAPNFGGHEMMTLRLLEQMARHGDYEITIVAADKNSDFCQHLGGLAPSVELLPTSYSSSRGQWLRTYLSIRPLLQLRSVIKLVRPDLLIVIQGGIALSSLGIFAGRLAGVRTLTYIPMTHDESIFSPSPIRARLRQFFVRPFYSLPHCLVTISRRMAGYAEKYRRGGVRVVPNGIALPDLLPESRLALRSALGLQDGDRLLLMIGRIEFWQKRHDLAIQALAIARSRDVRLHLLVVGSGEDEQALRELVRDQALDDVVHWRAWQTDVTAFYAACDVLVLPSRYEGVPLVMLEAMYAGKKVVAANVDGMADMLPSAWTFPSGDAGALADLLCAPDGIADTEFLWRHGELIANEYSLESFGQQFLRIIDEEAVLSNA